jgi:diaminopimelate epimerase
MGEAMALPFTKVEGLGNDFLVVDLRPGRPAAGAGGPSPEDPAVVRALCDRRFGVGGDGVLAILPSAKADARMRVLNADGSEAEMCGNGIRCVAKLLYETDPALRRPTLNIETGAGVLACGLDVEAGKVRTVAVDMGRPRLTRDEIPLRPGGSSRALREPISARGRTFAFTAVSMGNPHAVIFLDDASSLRVLAEELGPLFEHAERFPNRTNVEFAHVRSSGEIDVVVWERGSGITMACGTGACATVVAAGLESRLPPGVERLVHLPGGTLSVLVDEHYSSVRMRGPARVVFEASIDARALPRSGDLAR